MRSAATPVAVCSYCRSTLAREGDALKRLGRSAELFDDHSPLQSGTTGRWQTRAFTLVGRLQWRTEASTWNEWVMLFDDGARGWLSEDNGRYVVMFDSPMPATSGDALALGALSPVPVAPSGTTVLLPPDAWQAGSYVRVGEREWLVASVVDARVVAAEGELPQPPALDTPFTVVDLRSELGDVATLVAPGGSDNVAPQQDVDWSVGRGVELSELQLRGLRDGDVETAGAQGPSCPSCGAGLRIELDTTKSVVCTACKAVVDVSQGVGGQLAYFAQQRAGGLLAEPLIALGSTANLALGGESAPWQVVGYMVRTVEPEPGDDAEPPWTEYLLYSRNVGFAFLVNADDGWSYAVPVTGAPKAQGQHATWQGRNYAQRFSYNAVTTFVLGEFYWRVQQGQRSRNTDFAVGEWRLNREQQGQEITWSDGRVQPARALLSAFGVTPSRIVDQASSLDTEPLGSSSWGMRQVIVLVVVLLIVFALFRTCSTDRCDGLRQTYGAASVEYQQCLQRSRGSGVGAVRSGGGSWGGSSGGGGHK